MGNARAPPSFLYTFTVNGESDALIIWPNCQQFVRCCGGYKGTQGTVITPEELPALLGGHSVPSPNSCVGLSP